MSTLAYYSTIIKKEEILERIGEDAEKIAIISNDLVCDLKVASASAKSRDVETLITSLDKSLDLVKIISSMLDNLKNNSESYVNFLLPQKQEPVKEVEEQAKVKEPEEKKNTASSQEQLVSLVETLKSLKDMQDKMSK